MTTLLGIIFGAIAASGLQCLVMRTQKNQRWSAGFSCCDHCGKRLVKKVNIPVMGYLLTRGKSQCCKKTKSHMYLLNEVCGAVAGGLIGYQALTAGTWWTVASAAVLIAVLITLVSDGLYQEIWVPVVLVAGVIAAVLTADTWRSVLIGIAIGTTFFGGQWVLTRGKGIGAGDLFLGAAIGMSVGPIAVLPTIIAGYILATPPALFALSTGKATRKTKIPIGAYLAVAWMIGWFLQETFETVVF